VALHFSNLFDALYSDTGATPRSDIMSRKEAWSSVHQQAYHELRLEMPTCRFSSRRGDLPICLDIPATLPSKCASITTLSQIGLFAVRHLGRMLWSLSECHHSNQTQQTSFVLSTTVRILCSSIPLNG